MKSSADIRQGFLDYYEDKDHKIVSSSPLVPADDPTLLFTNAGMVQFKDTFLGRESRAYKRATSSQRCVRAGGKHNDLENVGYTARHHTFFEMLGNFSFGDYFKRDAIYYAWEYLTDIVGLEADRLWVTVFEEDDEAANIWLKDVGVDKSHFGRIGAKDNFWSMGDTGPCGPCTEIFYDHGADIKGGPPGSPDEDGDRYIEIWNLVFMQYDRSSDGELKPLPAPSVDTGMGLERLAAVMQGVHSNYEIDLFQNLIQAAAEVTHRNDLDNNSLKVIADHIRSCAFLVTDGVMPSNEGRGYVLRRIIRRAARHGHKLGQGEAFFHQLVKALASEMGEAYPELLKAQANVERVLKLEEERFAETLDQGMKILEQDLSSMTGKQISGETVFRLYDTFGFPVDLTADIARERDLEIDMAGFEAAMEAQRERARTASQFVVDYSQTLDINIETPFTGYDQTSQTSKIVHIQAGEQSVETLQTGKQATILLDQSPFYAESGGQVGDHGTLSTDKARFTVFDTQKQGKAILHIGELAEGQVSVGDSVSAHIDEERRAATIRNHSATHLMHAALRESLGDHVQQKGSLVDDHHLRFDFTHFEPVSKKQINKIERRVNEQIRLNLSANATEMPLDEAKATGAMALFGEKYDDVVRVVTMGDFSTELCGGTHVKRCGDIGYFRVVSESGIASGVRRIEAVTGERAVEQAEKIESQLARVASLVKSSHDDIEAKVQQLLDRMHDMDKELARLKAGKAVQAGQNLSAQAEKMGEVYVLAARLDGADSKALRDTLDQLKNKLGSAALLLASEIDGKVSLIAGVTRDQMSTIKAGELVNVAAGIVGGKGGGRPDMAQAGGCKPEKIDEALEAARNWLREKLS